MTDPTEHRRARVLFLDHADSFVFILADEFARAGARVDTYRADALRAADLTALVAARSPDLVVLSPGPGHPSEATTAGEWLATRPAVPVLGVCLGLQVMAHATGGTVGRAPAPVHGKADGVVTHGSRVPDHALAHACATALQIESHLRVARYHSLVVTDPGPALEVLATTRDAPHLCMAAAHRDLPWLGLQFHPESCLSPRGGALIQRLLHAVAPVATSVLPPASASSHRAATLRETL